MRRDRGFGFSTGIWCCSHHPASTALVATGSACKTIGPAAVRWLRERPPALVEGLDVLAGERPRQRVQLHPVGSSEALLRGERLLRLLLPLVVLDRARGARDQASDEAELPGSGVDRGRRRRARVGQAHEVEGFRLEVEPAVAATARGNPDDWEMIRRTGQACAGQDPCARPASARKARATGGG